MYEDFFALRTRPFSATGEGAMFVPIPVVEDALRTALDCVLAGKGPVLITGETGVGKSEFCAELMRRAGDRLHGLNLGSSGFHNRHEVWQSILCHFGREFTGLTEHEARLCVIDAARSLPSDREGVLLILDEAHRLGPQLLDELWQLSTHLKDRRPLIRLVLSGQLELEEQLATPELSALNQHLGAHIVLEPLTGDESRGFIAGQLERAGADLSRVFTSDAVELICRASDGSCRAINQLCDHSLLLAYVVEEQPVTSATVQAALDDLKGLPLHWNQPLPAPNEDSLTGGSDGAGLNGGGSPVGAAGNEELDVTQYAEVSTSRDDITEPALEWETSEMAVIEVGGDECGATNADVRRQIPEALQPDTDRAAHVTEPEQTHEFCIEDRYARLDQLAEAGLKLEREPRAAFADPAVVPAAPELQLLSQVTELRDEIHIVRPVESAGRLAAVDGYAGDETFPENDDNLTWDVIEPEWDAPTDDQPPTAAGNQDLTPAVAVPSPDVFDFTPIHDGLALLSSPSPATERCVARPAVSDGRRYAQLFTRLKRRRREVCEALRAMSPASGP